MHVTFSLYTEAEGRQRSEQQGQFCNATFSEVLKYYIYLHNTLVIIELSPALLKAFEPLGFIGQVGENDYTDENSGMTFGAQMETWW